MRELILVFVVNMVVLDFLVVVFLIFCMIIREIGFNVFFVYGNGGMFFCKMFIFFSDILLLVLI